MSDVLFRGPMMVFTQGSTVESIRIPDGEAPVHQHKHPDDDVASPHYSGLFVAQLPATPTTATDDRVVSLRSKRVVISDGTAGPCTADDSLKELMVDVNRLTENGATGPLQPVAVDATFFANGATLVEFRGGTLSVKADERTGLTYTLPGHFAKDGVDDKRKMPMLIRWTPSTGSTVTISIDDEPATAATNKTIALAANQTACVYQWDGNPSSTNPTPEEFMDLVGVECTKDSSAIIDMDFKWVYDVLTPVNGTWQQWRANKKLPAPISPCTPKTGADFVAKVSAGDDPKTAPGKDCLAGLWVG